MYKKYSFITKLLLETKVKVILLHNEGFPTSAKVVLLQSEGFGTKVKVVLLENEGFVTSGGAGLVGERRV